jgi:hypothetical protein
MQYNSMKGIYTVGSLITAGIIIGKNDMNGRSLTESFSRGLLFGIIWPITCFKRMTKYAILPNLNKSNNNICEKCSFQEEFKFKL